MTAESKNKKITGTTNRVYGVRIPGGALIRRPEFKNAKVSAGRLGMPITIKEVPTKTED